MNQTTDLFAQTSHSSVQSSWQVYGASSIGKSHIDSNLPNQDSIYLQKTQDGMVAVVCDGAGSAKFSQAGAAFFSQSIGKMLLSLGVSRSVSISGTAFDLVQVRQQIIEQLLQKLCIADERWSTALLRYFNPVGAHKSGRIGEDPQGIPNNLMPYVTQVAVGRREKLAIFGNDYDTVDGTGVRDYIHVVDLARAHLCALNNRLNAQGCRAWNIGTGNGSSVLQVKNTFEQVTGVAVAFEFVARRAGDVATSFADNARAVAELGWQPQYGLEDMLADSWDWQKQNPTGYKN